MTTKILKPRSRLNYVLAMSLFAGFILLVVLSQPQVQETIADHEGPVGTPAGTDAEPPVATSPTVPPPSTSPDPANTAQSTRDISTELEMTSNSSQAAIKNEFVQEKLVGDYIFTDGMITQPNRTYSTLATPNDPAANQWWHQALNLEGAWDITTGSSSTILAIIDTGIALDHEEFTGRIYENSGEVGVAVAENPSRLNCTDQSITLDMSCNQIDDNFDGIVDNESGLTTIENPSQLNCTDQSLPLDKSCNLIDDDGNSLADDWRGWDFINFDRSVQTGEMNPAGQDTRHATFVAGVAAGNANNNVGIAGVNWNTQILPIQAIDDDGYGNSLSVTRAVRYAIAQGADVINMSLGSVNSDVFLRQAIHDAIAQGIVIVAASGNNGCDCVSYPGNYPEVVTVGALNTANQRASFSNFGDAVDIMAPGTSIYTASWTAANPTSAYNSGVQGTSLATPLVSGIIASLKAIYPDASPTELLAIMTETTDRLSLISNRSDSLGFGAVDALAAYSRVGSPRTDALAYTFTPVSHGAQVGAELDSDIMVGGCASGVTASTPVYRLASGSSVIYTASQAERAQLSTYGSSFLGYGCVLHEFDTVSAVRAINVFQEFENRLPKD